MAVANANRCALLVCLAASALRAASNGIARQLESNSGIDPGFTQLEAWESFLQALVLCAAGVAVARRRLWADLACGVGGTVYLPELALDLRWALEGWGSAGLAAFDLLIAACILATAFLGATHKLWLRHAT